MSRLTMRQPTLSFAIHLHGRLVVLAPFPYLFGSLRQPGSAPASSCSGQAIEGLYLIGVSCAEPDVRVRVRGRVVSVHRQRGQVRVVRVVTATEATHQPGQCSRLIIPKNSTSPATATPIRLRHLVAGMDFVYCDSGTAAIHKPQQKPAGVYR